MRGTVREFECRCTNSMSTVNKNVVYGIKEEYKVVDEGNDSIWVTATFGIDSELSLTRPALYTSDAFKPFGYDKDSSMSFEEYMTGFMRKRNGLYSVLGVTMLICSISGRMKLVDGAYVWDSVSCEFFAPYKFASDSKRLITKRLGSDHPLDSSLREKIIGDLQQSIYSKETFISARCR